MSAMIEVQGALIKQLLDIYTSPINQIINLLPGLRRKNDEKRKKYTEEIILLIKELNTVGISLDAFDKYLESEIDRKMKQKYGAIFLVFTFIFTSASFSIIILNSMLGWNISDIAITGLIIQIPVQFVGILLIIANNLFPKKNN